MESDRYDPAYSFPTTMTTDNGEDEDDGNDDEEQEDTMAKYGRVVLYTRVIHGTMYNHRLAFSI